MEKLCAVGEVGVTLLLSSRIEVLVHAGCPVPVLSKTTVEVDVERVQSEVVAMPVDYSVESLVADTQLALSIYGIGNVAGSDSRL